MCRAKLRMSQAAFTALVARSLVAQATIGVLSHQQATWACLRSLNHSSTSHWRSSPSISRSELVISPVGFAGRLDLVLFLVETQPTIPAGEVFMQVHTRCHLLCVLMHHNSRHSWLVPGLGWSMAWGWR